MDRDYELQTHQAEDRHWWYRGRRTVLEGVIAELGLGEGARILDAYSYLGAFALAAKTMPEEQFVASFGSIAKDGEAWPGVFACTAVDAADGSFVVWEASSGVALGREPVTA